MSVDLFVEVSTSGLVAHLSHITIVVIKYSYLFMNYYLLPELMTYFFKIF